MKISQKSGFQPITITLETEEEAINMWIIMDIPPATIRKSCEYSFNDKFSPELHQKMFETFDSIFDPRKKNENE